MGKKHKKHKSKKHVEIEDTVEEGNVVSCISKIKLLNSTLLLLFVIVLFVIPMPARLETLLRTRNVLPAHWLAHFPILDTNNQSSDFWSRIWRGKKSTI